MPGDNNDSIYWAMRGRKTGSGSLAVMGDQTSFVSDQDVSDPSSLLFPATMSSQAPRAEVGTTGQMGVRVHKLGTHQMPHGPRIWRVSIYYC